jgi:hypothetical protein
MKNILIIILFIYIIKMLNDEMKANQIHNATMLSAFSSIIRVNNQSVNFVPNLNNLPI